MAAYPLGPVFFDHKLIQSTSFDADDAVLALGNYICDQSMRGKYKSSESAALLELSAQMLEKYAAQERLTALREAFQPVPFLTTVRSMDQLPHPETVAKSLTERANTLTSFADRERHLFTQLGEWKCEKQVRNISVYTPPTASEPWRNGDASSCYKPECSLRSPVDVVGRQVSNPVDNENEENDGWSQDAPPKGGLVTPASTVELIGKHSQSGSFRLPVPPRGAFKADPDCSSVEATIPLMSGPNTEERREQCRKRGFLCSASKKSNRGPGLKQDPQSKERCHVDAEPQTNWSTPSFWGEKSQLRGEENVSNESERVVKKMPSNVPAKDKRRNFTSVDATRRKEPSTQDHVFQETPDAVYEQDIVTPPGRATTDPGPIWQLNVFSKKQPAATGGKPLNIWKPTAPGTENNNPLSEYETHVVPNEDFGDRPVFADYRERFDALSLYRAQNPGFPVPHFFRYGVSYSPDPCRAVVDNGNDDRLSRTSSYECRVVIISNLPRTATLTDVLSLVRGGRIVRVSVCLGVGYVDFVDWRAAHAYVDFVTHHTKAAGVQTMVPEDVTVQLANMPTYPVERIAARYLRERFTRCLVVEAVTEREVAVIGKTLVWAFARLDCALEDAWTVGGIHGDESALYLLFDGVARAGRAWELLCIAMDQASFKKVHVAEDPCAGDLAELYSPSASVISGRAKAEKRPNSLMDAWICDKMQTDEVYARLRGAPRVAPGATTNGGRAARIVESGGGGNQVSGVAQQQQHPNSDNMASSSFRYFTKDQFFERWNHNGYTQDPEGWESGFNALKEKLSPRSWSAEGAGGGGNCINSEESAVSPLSGYMALPTITTMKDLDVVEEGAPKTQPEDANADKDEEVWTEDELFEDNPDDGRKQQKSS